VDVVELADEFRHVADGVELHVAQVSADVFQCLFFF
jgi:hypothetical protein